MKTHTKRSVVIGIVVLSWLMLMPSAGMAAPIFETTEYITGIEGQTYRFDIAAPAGEFKATLSDLSYGPLEFDFVGLSISTAEQTLGAIDAPGTIFFSGIPDTNYYANVFGVGAGDFDTGLLGVQVEAVPLPPSLIFLLSGVVLIAVSRRRLAYAI